MLPDFIKMIYKYAVSDLQSETLFESMNPFSCLYNDEIIQTKSKDFVCVIKLQGKEYSGLDESTLEELYKVRRNFFLKTSNQVKITIHSKREIDNLVDVTHYYCNNKYADKLTHVWNSNFKTNYITSHYIVIYTTNKNKKLSNIASNNLHTKENAIEDTKNDVLQLLDIFKPKLLRGSSLISYYSSYLNGYRSLQKQFDNKIINSDIIETNIEFPKNKDYMVQDGIVKTYSKWVAIKGFENDNFDSKLIDDLMSLRVQFELFQNVKKYTTEETKKYISDKIKHTNNIFISSDDTIKELKSEVNKAEEGKLYLYEYRFSIQVKHTNLNKLNEHVEKVHGLIKNYQYATVIEKTNIEPLFWAALPTYEKYNPRMRVLKDDNLSSLCTFTNSSSGFTSCDWGNSPLTKFYTEQNSIYNFILHENTDDEALAHTLYLGGSNIGKTTLASFKMSQSIKYPNMKIFILDKLQGMRVMVEFFDGIYNDFNESINLNPLHLDDTNLNRSFLQFFFSTMSGKHDSASLNKVNNALSQLYRYNKKSDRNLTEFKNNLGAEREENDLVSEIDTWVNGARSIYFNGKTDSLDFSSQITAFNMDTALNDPKAAALLALYLFHKLKVEVEKTNSPFIVFVDEVPAYLENEDFAAKFVEILLEFRKKRGCLMMAAQSYKFFKENKYGRKILGESLANIIVYPTNTADEEFKETLKLTSEEYNFVKNNVEPRRILFKRFSSTGESIVLNVNLAPLGKYLNIFSSGTPKILEMKKLKEKSPLTWKEEFLKWAE